MKRTAILLALCLLAAPFALLAESSDDSSGVAAQAPSAPSTTSLTSATHKPPPALIKPLSHMALSGGVSLMGGNMQAALNLNRYMNLRATGNYFTYTVNNISTNGFNVNANVNMMTAGAGVDFYPFPRHGFRLSPGVLVRNENALSANGIVSGGTSFKLNEVTYYSATTNAVTGATPINVTGSLGLHTNKQAFTMTTGWGNMIPRKGGHWSFPFEIGAAFTGAPSLNVGLTGWACTDQAQTLCANLADATNPISTQVQSSLTTQVAKWKSDLDPLKYYPILSFGVSYSFRIR